MKNKFFAFLLVLICGLFFACTPAQSTPDNQGGTPESEKTAYKVVCPSGYKGTGLSEIFYAVGGMSNVSASMGNDESAPTAHEIVLGRTNRAISETAYELLARVENENENYIGFLIYSDGSSVALAYEEDRYLTDASVEAMIDCFIENYITGKSEFYPGEEGIVDAGLVDYVEYQRAEDKNERESTYASIRSKVISYTGDAVLADDIVEVCREYYSIVSPDLVSWLANLYDPDIDAETRDEGYPQRGGFYYSNSGRNTVGFLPDLESTGQALTILNYSGILDHIGGTKGLPDWMREQMGNFAKSLQDPNGFFYHPQWGKALTDTNQERRSRDTSWAISILSTAGMMPTYNIYTRTGDGKLIDGTVVDSSGNVVASSKQKLTERLRSDDIVSAVSRVVPTASGYVSPELLTEADFYAWLDGGCGYNIRTGSYAWGSFVCSRTQEYIERDKQLAAEGADWRCGDVLIKYLNDNQNPENGVWYWKDFSSSEYSYYDAVNGLLKIGGTYTSFGVSMPHALEACQTAINALYSDAKPRHVCDVYNPWFAVGNVFTNITTCNDDKNAGIAERDRIRATLLADAPNSIHKTFEKIATFLKKDGSFSYLPNMTSCTSTGMTVALNNTNEGDVNATLIAAVDIRDRMFGVLGLPTVDLFGKAEYYEFINIIEELDPVIKDEDTSVLEPVTFDDYAIGDCPSDEDINTSMLASGGECMIISDPRPKVSGNVFRFESKKGKGEQLRFPTGNTAMGADCSVFEAEMCFESANSGYTVQLVMDYEYMMGLRFDSERVYFFDSSSQTANRVDRDFGASVAIGEWFKLRIEYYPGDHDTVRIKVYLNDALIAVSDNYYDYYGKKITNGEGTPSKSYTYFDILGMKAAEFVCYIDNVKAGKTRNEYEITVNKTRLDVDVDAPLSDGMPYDFEDSEDVGGYPYDFTVTENSGTIEVKDTEDSKQLYLKGNKGEGFKLEIPTSIMSKTADMVLVEADMSFAAADAGTTIELALRQRGSGFLEYAVTGYTLKIEDQDGEKYVVMYECPAGTVGVKVSGIKIPADQAFKLRIEYYTAEKTTLIYIDGALVGLSSAVNAGVEKYTVGELIIADKAKAAFELYVDNIRAVWCEGSFNEATKPTVDRVVHKFDNADGVSLSGNATVKDGYAYVEQDGALSVMLNKRSVATNTVVLESYIQLNDSGYARIALVDSDAESVLVYDLIAKDGKVYIHEVTEKQTYEEPIASFDAGHRIKLTIEYFVGRDAVQIFINGTCAATSALQYNDSAKDREIKALDVTVSAGTLILDNLVIEAYNKLYEEKDTDGDNSEDTADTLTFEGSTSGNLPSRVTTSFGSGGASVRVDEILTQTERSKALILTTSSGGADTIRINAQKKSGSYNAIVFESDVSIHFNGNVYMYFKAGSSDFYRINLNMSSGSLHVDDNTGLYPNGPYGTMGNPDIKVKLGEWVRLRFEMYNNADGAVNVRISVNGKYLMDSTEPTWTGNVFSVTSVNMTTNNGSVGDFMLDNVYFGYGNMTIDTNDVYNPDDGGSSGGTTGGSSGGTTDIPTEKDTETFEDGVHGITIDGQNTGSIKTEDGNKYYSVSKTTKIDDYIYIPKSSYSPTDANCTVFEAKLRIVAYSSTEISMNILYGRWNGMRKFTFTTAAGSSVLKLDDWREGASTSLSVADTGAVLGEWFTIRIENYLNADGETIARVYINGINVGESTNAGVLGSASANHHLNNLVVKANNSIAGSVDLDDVYFGSDVMLTYDARPVEDFEDGVHGISIDGGSTRTPGSIVTDGDNSYYNKPTDTSDYLYFQKSTYEPEGADCTVFEAKMRINHAGSGECSFKILYGTWKGMDKFTFYNPGGGEEIKVYDSRSGVSSTLTCNIGAKINEWFTLRIENYLNSDGETVARVYVNGILIGESTNIGVLGAESDNHTLDTVALLLNNNIRGTGAEGDVYGSVDIDDVYLGLDKMIEVEEEEVKLPYEDFEDDAHDITIDGTNNATVSAEDGNKYYSKPGGTTDYLYIPKNSYNPEGANSTVIEMKLRIAHTGANECSINIIYGRWNGMYKFIISNPDGDELVISDWRDGATTTLAKNIGAKLGEWFTLRIENYENESGELIARVYVNGELIGESTNAGVLGLASANHHLNNLVVKTNNNVSGSVDFDDVYFGLDKMIETDFTSDFEDSAVESSGGAVSNSDVTVTLSSTGASAEIAEAEGNKYLVVNTNNDSGDTVTAVAAAGETSADCFVFETDLNFSYEKSRGNSLYLIFYNKAGNTLYRININTDSITGLIRVDDNPGNGVSYGTIGNKPITPEIGDWFKLRIELYNETESGNLQAKIYINGKFAYESTESAWASGSYESVAKITLTTNTYSVGAVMYDNMLLAPGKQLAIAQDTEEAKAEILGTKTGADGIVVIMHDDGNTPASAQLIDTLFEKYGLKGDVALIANRLYTDYDITGTPDMTVVNAWQALFDTGRWNLTNHSLSHTFWGSYDDSSITVDPDRLTEEIVTSQEILRNLFPDRRVLTYAIPGMSAVTANHSKYSVYKEALELLKEHYIGVRDYEGTATAAEYIVWNLVPAEVIGISWTPETVDEAAAGNVAVIFCHNVPEETSYENMETILSKVAGYVEEGKVWNAFFEEAVMYLSEREAAELSVTESSSRITVKLTDSLDDEIYNMPLTVRVTVPTDWAEVRVTEGDAISYATAKELDGKWVVDISVTPDGDDAIITPTVYVDDGTKVSEYGVTLTNGQKLDKNYFPGHVRKAVTFTIDDGDITNDTKFIDIVKPAGIAGTFNLINTKATTAAAYLALYEGFEIASHHQLHCLPWMDNVDFTKIEIKDEVFNASTADPTYMYKNANIEGLYYIDYHHIDAGVASPSWHAIAVNDTYTEYIDLTKANIESVFGEGSVVGFAYPHGQLNQAVKQYLINAGYLYARRTGLLGSSTSFAMPEDRFAWVYNANVSNLNTCMAEFDALEDDGELKFFSFGVHAVDFSGKWDVLEAFADEYGNRPREFWYATNREIFEYEDALNKLEIYDDKLVNPTDLDLFVTIDDVKTVIYANSTYELSEQ